MRRLLAPLLITLAMPATAQVLPSPGPGDPRLQTVLYNPNQVVQLQVASGYTLMVQFLPGEKIETIAVGDTSGWQVTANKRGDYLFIKSGGGGPTNMTVATDGHVYVFELRPAGGGGLLPYAVKFVDPEPPVRPVAAMPAETGTYRYKLSGTKALRPTTIAIENNRLALEWPAKMPLPAVFKVEQDGQEMAINGEMQNGRLMIDGMPQRLIFRIDRQTATAVRVAAKGRRS